MLPWSPNSLMLPAAAFAASAAALTAYSTFAPRGGLFGPVVSRSPRTNTHAVALTFDDGPWPGSTDTILDVLNDPRRFGAGESSRDVLRHRAVRGEAYGADPPNSRAGPPSGEPHL